MFWIDTGGAVARQPSRSRGWSSSVSSRFVLACHRVGRVVGARPPHRMATTGCARLYHRLSPHARMEVLGAVMLGDGMDGHAHLAWRSRRAGERAAFFRDRD